MNILMWMALGGVIGSILAVNASIKKMTNFYVNIILGVTGILLGGRLLYTLLHHEQSFANPLMLMVLSLAIGLFYGTYTWLQHSNNTTTHERR